jgi:hypothetical protein
MLTDIIPPVLEFKFPVNWMAEMLEHGHLTPLLAPFSECKPGLRARKIKKVANNRVTLGTGGQGQFAAAIQYLPKQVSSKKNKADIEGRQSNHDHQWERGPSRCYLVIRVDIIAI